MLVIEKIIILSAMLVIFGIFLMYFIPALDEVNESKKKAEENDSDNEQNSEYKILKINHCNTISGINEIHVSNLVIPMLDFHSICLLS